MTDNDKALVEALLCSPHISNVAITDRAAARLQALAARVKVLEAENERLRAALEDAEYALVSADRFIFQKHATRNECRTDAIAAVRAALGNTQ